MNHPDNSKAQNSSGIKHALKVSVPDSWKIVPLKEVLEQIIGGGTPSRKNPSYWHGSIPWLTVKDMRTRRPKDSIDHITEQAVENSSINIIPANTVIIATRIGLGKVVRVPFDSAINQDLKALVAKPIVDKSYLEYWIYSIANYLESIGSGTTVKGIRLEQVRSLPFPLAPLNQQKRIVAEIEKQFSRLDEAVANLKRVKANLKRYKAAVLKAAVEGKLTEEWRKAHPDAEPASKLLDRILAERRAKWEESELAKMEAKGKAPKNDKWKAKYKDPALPEISGLPGLPEGWGWSVLELVAELVDPQPSHRTPAEISGGIPYIGMGDIGKDGQIDFEGARKVSKFILEEHKNRYQLRNGDFVFGKIGTIGQPCMLPEPFDYTLSANVILVQPSQEWILPTFVFSCLDSVVVKTYVGRECRATTQAAFGIKKMRRIPIPIPPLAEQKHIVTEVDRLLTLIHETESQVDTTLKRAQHLRQSVLSKAFSGQLVIADDSQPVRQQRAV